VCVCMCVYIYIYMYVHTHTHTKQIHCIIQDQDVCRQIAIQESLFQISNTHNILLSLQTDFSVSTKGIQSLQIGVSHTYVFVFQQECE
jgi:hypothetical protein